MKEESKENGNNKIIHDNPYGLLEDASGNVYEVARLFDKQRHFMIDTSNPLDDRIEVFEDIIDSEVGDTSCVRARNIEREVNLRQIFLKFEGGNPTGTQKDRIAFAQCMDALRRGFDAITIATCGNYGAAAALAASLSGLKCYIYVPETYHTRRIKEMEHLGSEIVRVPGDYEVAVEKSQERANRDEIYDANPGGNNTILQLKAYGQIAYEIYDDLSDAPKIVAIPVSNGTLLAGVFKGFVSLYRRGKTSRIPKVVAGSSFGKNPIVQAFIHNKERCEDLIPYKIKETRVNEPLINWHSFDGDLALEAVRKSNGWAAGATDKSMLYYSRLIREKEGINVLPASTAGLVAIINKHIKEPMENDRFVVLLTGRKS